MKVEVEIPGGKYCNWPNCQLRSGHIYHDDNTRKAVRYLHDWCNWLWEQLDCEIEENRINVLKHPDCPSLGEKK